MPLILHSSEMFGRFSTLSDMRVVGEIPHPDCKVTLLHWNNRYLIKVEQGLLEQTYKVQEYDVATEEDVRRLVSEEFIAGAVSHFESMRRTLEQAMQRI